MRLWYLSHMRPAKAQASLCIRTVSPEPSLFAHMKYGSRRRVRLKIRHLAPLDRCACAFEERIYGGQKVPKSHELAGLVTSVNNLLYHRYIIVCLLQLGGTDPNLTISWDVLTSLVQHLTGITVILQSGKS